MRPLTARRGAGYVFRSASSATGPVGSGHRVAAVVHPHALFTFSPQGDSAAEAASVRRETSTTVTGESRCAPASSRSQL